MTAGMPGSMEHANLHWRRARQDYSFIILQLTIDLQTTLLQSSRGRRMG